MNDAHYHLLVNHLPIVGVLIGFLVLVVGLITKKTDVKLTALGILIFSALASIAAFYTGEGAEEVVEKISGISETLIHTHEEYAETFYTLSLVMGGFALVAFILELKKLKFSRLFIILTLLLALSDGIAAKYAGTSGGEIRHTEIRTDGKAIHLENGE
jgi:flagellar motor component MotA